MDGLKLERGLLSLLEQTKKEKAKHVDKGEYTVEIRDTYKSWPEGTGKRCSFNWIIYVTAPDGSEVSSTGGHRQGYADTMWGAKREAKKAIKIHKQEQKRKQENPFTAPGMTYKVKA